MDTILTLLFLGSIATLMFIVARKNYETRLDLERRRRMAEIYRTVGRERRVRHRNYDTKVLEFKNRPRKDIE